MTRLYLKNTLTMLAISLLLLSSSAFPQYKDFVRKETKVEFFSITFDKNSITISVPNNGQAVSATVQLPDVDILENEVRVSNNVRFGPTFLEINGIQLEYEKIIESKISSGNEQTTISFYTDTRQSRVEKVRAGNIVAYSEPINITPNDFVRGMVLSIFGPIAVNGEVNKDIVSLFGNISLTSNAVVRGDILSITGDISVETQASIYGEIYSGTKDYDSKRFRFYQEDELTPGLMLNYNRVDGVLLGGTLGFVHSDSAFPTLKVGFGYAMESERSRFFVRASQLVVRRRSISIGGEYYKKLESEDDRLISDGENIPFVLLATEDFKDYYESEGGAGWIEFHPCHLSSAKIGYRYDDTHWLRSHRYMWSMFGGSKLFPENFGTVEQNYRAIGIVETDQSNNAAIFINYEFDSRNDDLSESVNGWGIEAGLEWSSPDLSSDFDYQRYLLSLVRYQKINKYSSFRLRGEFAGSDGYLPMYKRFFLGGLGTLWGYRHKEFMGSRYWLANAEYWVNLPNNFESNLIIFWDVARISNSPGFEDYDEVRNDIGIGLYIAEIRLNLAKRLDSDPERNPRFYLRFSKSF